MYKSFKGNRSNIMLLAAFACLLVFLSGCAAMHIQRKKEYLGNYMQRQSAYFTEGPSCIIGIISTQHNQRIYAITPYAEGNGLKLGDKILAVDGQEVHSRFDIVNKIASKNPDDNVDFKVERNGQVKTIQANCGNGQERRNLFKAALEAGKNGNWSKCMKKIDKLENTTEYRPEVPAFAMIKAGCKDGKRLAKRRPVDLYQASLMYEAGRRQIYSHRNIGEDVEVIQSSVMSLVSSLRAHGFQSMADKLTNRLEKEPKSPKPSGPTEGPVQKAGTCFAVSSEGHILTANHVISGAESITVYFSRNQGHKAQILKTSQRLDISLLKIRSRTPHALPLIKTSTVSSGESVFTVGFPAVKLLGPEPKYTEGSISSMSGPGGEGSLMQISVPIQPGNSGGPLVNQKGEVVGIILAKAAIKSFFAATGTLPQNVNWAVKSDYVMPLLPEVALQNSSKNSSNNAIQSAKKAICQVRGKRK